MIKKTSIIKLQDSGIRFCQRPQHIFFCHQTASGIVLSSAVSSDDRSMSKRIFNPESAK